MVRPADREMAAPGKLVCFSQTPEEETHPTRQGSTGRHQGGQEAEGAGKWGRSLCRGFSGRTGEAGWPGLGLASWKDFSGLWVQGLSLVLVPGRGMTMARAQWSVRR